VSLTRNHGIVRYPENIGHSIGTISSSNIGIIQPATSLFGMPRDSDVMKVNLNSFLIHKQSGLN